MCAQACVCVKIEIISMDTFRARKSLMKTENNANADEIYSLAQQKIIIIKRHRLRERVRVRPSGRSGKPFTLL